MDVQNFNRHDVSLPQAPRRRNRAAGFLTICLLSISLFGVTGCNWIGWLGYAVAGNEKTTKVKAKYPDLAGHSFGVLVSADEHALFDQPNAREAICHVLTRQLMQDVENITPIDPRQIVKFQEENPYWETLPYGDLLNRLKVERLIVVDVVTYQLHQPGNNHVWQGRIVSHINVAEAETANSNNLAFAQSVETVFPKDRPIGLLDVEESTFRVRLLDSFARDVSDLFHDHKVVEER